MVEGPAGCAFLLPRLIREDIWHAVLYAPHLHAGYNQLASKPPCKSTHGDMIRNVLVRKSDPTTLSPARRFVRDGLLLIFGRVLSELDAIILS